MWYRRAGAGCRALADALPADREGDDRDVAERIGEIGRLPLRRDDGVESVIASTSARRDDRGSRTRAVAMRGQASDDSAARSDAKRPIAAANRAVAELSRAR